MKQSAQPTDYERAYHLSRKLAYKRLSTIRELKAALKELLDLVDAHLESYGASNAIDHYTTHPARSVLKKCHTKS